MHLLQVCNVGNLRGGTAACVWTFTRALPECRHTVLFLSPPTDETVAAFEGCRIEHTRRVDDAAIGRHAPDVVLLHNTSPDRCAQLRSVVTIQYRHSTGRRTPADMTVACSRWLADQAGGEVLYQAVPVPPRLEPDAVDRRHLDDELVIGRLCTPTMQKWPPSLVPFHAELHRRFPVVFWEFVGAPTAIQQTLTQACAGRVRFLPASWLARGNFWRWHALLYHHPTLTESFGRTAAEAMRAGCIPIVDARGGFREQVTHGRTGFLAADIDAFMQSVQAIQDPAQRWMLSRQARAAAERRFSLRRLAGDLRRLFDRAAAFEVPSPETTFRSSGLNSPAAAPSPGPRR